MAQQWSDFHEVTNDVFYVKITVVGGRFRGILGAIYRKADYHHAYKLYDAPAAVGFGDTEGTSSDMTIDMVFRQVDHREDFIKAIKRIFRLPDILRKSAPNYKPRVNVELKTFRIPDSKLAMIEYGEIEAISPPGSIDYDFHHEIQDLDSFKSSESSSKKLKSVSSRSAGTKRSPSAQSSARSSGRLSAITKETPMFDYQTIEDPDYMGIPYKLHLIPKSWNRPDDINNYLAGSWAFHQFLDGLNMVDGLPGLVVDFLRADGTTVNADDGVRYKVFITIRFFNETSDKGMKDQFRERLKGGSVVKRDGSIETFVHVLNVERFKMNLGVKKLITEEAVSNANLG